ncbi:MAG: hypothetical protein R3248_06670 [Candidatus Promineifilaceae bacterium]|nr:hypothetical protein [Candidatus Promineifilaceae bacterium]
MSSPPDVNFTQTNPYVGPRTFEEADRDRFFGRELEARELLSLVISEPLVLFYAQSGAGKSSLLNARLIPRLREREFEVLPTGRVGGGLPTSVDSVANIFVFNLLTSIDQDRSPAKELQELTLVEYLARRRITDRPLGDSVNGERRCQVLIIDQFEEIVTTHPGRWREREGFFRQLNQALREDDYLWVVLTMREDHAAALSPYTELLTERMRARFHMQRMEVPAALEAIREPAARAGRPFAPGVAERLVDNLRQIHAGGGRSRPGQFVEPVQLQVVCYQLWQQLAVRPPGPISHQDVEELANVDSALAQFYEQALARVIERTGYSELQLRNWFDDNLITEAGTRGTVYQGADLTAGMDTTVVKLLADHFLLRAEIRSGGTWYELIHDRFVSPIQQANERWRQEQSPLLLAAAAWERGDRRRDMLYEGEQLENALATVNRDTADPLVRDFLDASEAGDSEQKLAEAQARAAEQARRTEAEARNARRMRRISRAALLLFVAGIIAAVIALVANNAADQSRLAAEAASTRAFSQQLTAESASGVALNQQGTAEALSALALAQQATAEGASTRAFEQRSTAVAARDEGLRQQALALEASTRAVEQQTVAESARSEALAQQQAAETSRQEVEARRRLLLAQTLAFHALNIGERTQDSELVTLLLLQADHIRNDLPAGAEVDAGEVEKLEETMIAAAQFVINVPYFSVTFRGSTGAVRAVTVQPGGDALFAAADDGSITTWSLANPGEPAEMLTDGETPAEFVSMTADARLLAFGRADETISLWRLDEPDDGPLTLEAEAPLLSLAISPDGRSLAASTEAGDLLRWDLQAAEPVRRRLTDVHPRGFRQLIFAPPDNTLHALAPGTPRSFVYTWFPDGTLTLERPFLPLAFSPDGTLAAFANPNPELFQVSEVVLIAPADTTDFLLTNEADTVLRPPVAFSPDNQLLAEARGSQIRLWQLNTNVGSGTAQVQTLLGGHADDVTALAFAPDGDLLSGSADGSVRLWQPNTLDSFEDLLRRGCSQIARNLSWSEWQSYLPGEVYQATCSDLPEHFTVPDP